MIRSLYIASTGMLVQRKKMDILTNNITNIETIGYKKDNLISRSFKDMMIERVNDPYIINATNIVGNQNTGVHIDEIVTGFQQGSMEDTGRLSDVALQGSGFFVVSTPEGDRYTRDGSFAVNKEGYLVNSDGLYISGEKGRIFVGKNEFVIDEQGNVAINDTIVNKLKIASFGDVSALRKQGNNLYMNYNNQQILSTTDTKAQQGCLEYSNVDMAEEMVNIMAVSRTYETNQRIVKMIDESLDKTVNEVGRV